MTAPAKLKTALWPTDPVMPSLRPGHRYALDRAVHSLDRLPLGRRLALAVLIITWPWRD